MIGPGPERLRISYLLTCGPGERAVEKARDIALEQTVELPVGAFPEHLEDSVVGRVETIERIDDGRLRAVVSFDMLTIGGEVTQLLNLIFGNISMKSGIRVERIDWPSDLLAHMPGPRHGIAGLRELAGATEPRPLLCAALKPMGLSAEELARRCYELAMGGTDIIKDDHGLANQRTAPFKARMEACQRAVEKANRATNGRSVYFPNLTGRACSIDENVEAARAAGCKGALVSPLLVGPDVVRWLAETSGLALLCHPTLAGAFFADGHGIAPEVLLGQIFRMIGADGVIYANVGGRFRFNLETCEAINANLREPLGSLRASFPVPGGGIQVDRVPYWIERYGHDTIFLIGGSFYVKPDLRAAVSDLKDTIRRHCERAVAG